jgi:hypothetical protein
MLFSRSDKREDMLSPNIYGCDDIKRLLIMALESNPVCSILLAGTPASAKTLSLVFDEAKRFLLC